MSNTKLTNNEIISFGNFILNKKEKIKVIKKIIIEEEEPEIKITLSPFTIFSRKHRPIIIDCIPDITSVNTVRLINKLWRFADKDVDANITNQQILDIYDDLTKNTQVKSTINDFSSQCLPLIKETLPNINSNDLNILIEKLWDLVDYDINEPITDKLIKKAYDDIVPPYIQFSRKCEPLIKEYFPEINKKDNMRLIGKILILADNDFDVVVTEELIKKAYELL